MCFNSFEEFRAMDSPQALQPSDKLSRTTEHMLTDTSDPILQFGEIFDSKPIKLSEPISARPRIGV